MSKNIYILFLLLLGLFPGKVDAQQPSKKNILIKGTIVDKATNTPIEYATIMMYDLSSKETITGTTTEIDGSFELPTKNPEIYLEASFIGYTSAQVSKVSVVDNIMDLGTIALSTDANLLDEVEVTETRSTTEFKLDKRVFNVGQDLSNTGASALEVLNNVPSVNVNIEGEVSLRGSAGVQILINGKPSILTNEQGNALGTITADMIEKVEVITNPSAKYEAEGTAGIINIIIKKEEKRGVNGSVSVNVGWPHNHSVGLSLNQRTEKFNLFTQLGAGYRELPTDKRATNIDRVTGVTVNSIGEEFRNEKFYNFILGTDYYINPRNVITLSGSFTYEIEDQPSHTFFELSDDNNVVTDSWERTEVTEATNPKIQYELQYKRDFEDHKDHQLLFSAIGNYFGKEQSSAFENTISNGTISFDNQLTATKFEEGKYIFNLDYTKPFDDKWTLEAGGQYLLNDVSNDFEVTDIINNENIVDEGLTNVFQYDQKVLGVYTTGAYENGIWGMKLGLRIENTDLKTLLVNTNEKNDRNFTNYFPSVHTSYKVSESISFQAGYSRRIFRPRLWDLNPFFNIRNNFSIRQGNPNLLPEFTDSYEVGSIFIFDKTSFNFSVFHRYTTAVIERVSTFENNINTVLPLNVGTNNSTGLELNFKYSPNKKITITGDGNYNIFNRKGEFNDTNFDFNADQWSTKITTKYKVNKQLDMEATGRYQSKEKTIQGESADNLFADFGCRYKILNGKAVVNFSVRDIFASRVRESFADQPGFYTYSRRQRGRFLSLGFSYGFGKGEAMQYSGRRRR